jgi:hypothetical protein
MMGANIIPIQGDGTGCSERWNGAKWLAWVKIYYVDSDGRALKQLEDSGGGEGGEIGNSPRSGAKRVLLFCGQRTSVQSWKSVQGVAMIFRRVPEPNDALKEARVECSKKGLDARWIIDIGVN